MKEFKIRASACGKIMGVRGLGKTGKSYCEDWLKEQVFNRKKSFQSKFTDKGLIMEDNSIDFIADQLGYGFLVKNEVHFENDFCQGTPDIILKDHIIDVKNSWDCFTFPFFDKEIPNTDYYWQAQCYMELLGLSHYKLIYVLSDTPKHLIEREALYYAENNGYDELDNDLYLEFENKMTYSDIKPTDKIKVFDIEYNKEDVEKIKDRVEECRKIIKELL